MASKNRISKTINERSLFDDATALIDTATDINQGDLCLFTQGVIRAIKSTDTGVNFIGIARKSTDNGVLTQPYSTDTSRNSNGGKIAGPVVGVIAKLVAKQGEAWAVGAYAYPYPNSGTYHVTSTASGLSAIGIYQGAAITSALTGQEVEILLGENLGGTLKF